ncbi:MULTISPECIES: hypothetical protein [unclassified Nocardia]|uniref:hypothetical protein n=1 Tax=unclassified Nocardia TaxID=2637762 RepID=UPI0024A982E4|nr:MULTISPECIES: hypothetical protein [unclassified Nocardia]
MSGSNMQRHASAVKTHPLELSSTGSRRKVNGEWAVPMQIRAESPKGTVTVDFTRAFCPHREIDMRVDVGSGSVVLVVPRGWRVHLDEVRTDAGRVVNRVKRKPFPGARVVRVSGHVESGVVKARYPYRYLGTWFKGRSPH